MIKERFLILLKNYWKSILFYLLIIANICQYFTHVSTDKTLKEIIRSAEAADRSHIKRYDSLKNIQIITVEALHASEDSINTWSQKYNALYYKKRLINTVKNDNTVNDINNNTLDESLGRLESYLGR